jgi:lysyl-tRNA synthetase class 1
MLKRFTGTRELSVVDIPQYMNEFDELEALYFGKKPAIGTKERAKLTGLYKYCWWLNPPSTPSIHVPYNLLTYLVKIAPEGNEKEYAAEKLQEIGYATDEELLTEEFSRRVQYAVNWNDEFLEIKVIQPKLAAREEDALTELISFLHGKVDAETIQSSVFNIARNHNIKPRRFFRLIYTILLGTPVGPRLGPYVIAMGKQNVIEALERAMM